MPFSLIETPRPQSFDIPLIGDDLSKIGRIVDLWSQPCQPSAEIWVYASFQAIPTLFITLTKPELWDINIRHKRGKPRKGKRFKVKPNAIFRDSLINIPVPRWVVFRIYEWGQRIGWYFLVADALEDFGINWMSMAYRYQGCQLPTLTYADYLNNNVFQGSGTSPSSRRFIWNADAASNMSISATSCQPITGGIYRIGWQCTFRPYEVAAQSQMPYTTYCVVDGQVVGQGEMGEGGGNTRYSSGSALIVVDGPPYPEIQIHGAWLDASKFCWMSGNWNTNLWDIHGLGPDP